MIEFGGFLLALILFLILITAVGIKGGRSPPAKTKRVVRKTASKKAKKKPVRKKK